MIVYKVEGPYGEWMSDNIYLTYKSALKHAEEFVDEFTDLDDLDIRIFNLKL